MISRDKEQNKDKDILSVSKAAEVIGNSKELRGCMWIHQKLLPGFEGHL